MKIINLPKIKFKEDELENIPYQIRNKKVYVKYFDDGVQAGFPSPAEDFKDAPLSLDEKYLENPESTYLVKVVGESMYPTLHKDDVLIVKSNLDVKDGEIAIVSVNNTDFTVKRFNKKTNTLIADNTSYSNIKVETDDTLICLGVVKHLVRDL